MTLDLNGSGADQAIGSVGNDTLIGSAGDDWATGGAGSDHFNAGAGADLLIIDADDYQADIDAGAGIDTVLVADDRGVFLNLAKTHSEVVYGGYGDDVLVGGGADNYFIDGAAGDDLIIGGSADDVLSGGDGNDVLEGLAGDDLIRGHRGNDQLLGGDGNDVLDGGLDNDDLQGGNGNDVIIASGGTDTVDGGAGTDLIELKGQLEEYRFAKNADASWTITDTQNSDGSAVLAGQVSNRDGVQTVKNVERFSFLRGQTPTAVDFTLPNPLPVNDRVEVNGTASGYSIAVSSLLANDLDLQNPGSPQLSIYWVGDALGGSVALSADGKTITFTPKAGSSVVPEFSYKVKDAQGNTAPVVANVADPTVSGEMKARVLLVPANAPADPDYAKQWYLGAINAQTAWNMGYTGQGVQVLVLEPSGQFAVSRQAADLNHPDLVDNKSAEFIDTANHSVHATAVAGVIGADRNGIGGVGVAYDSDLNSIGMVPENSVSGYQADLANLKHYDIVNNSWGHTNPWNDDKAYLGASVEQASDNQAIENAVRQGRNGLGTVLIFGAGNDRAKAYDAGLSSLTNNAWTINVGAINRTGDIGGGSSVVKPFSNRGANILVAAPGSNIVTSGVRIETANGSVVGADSQETQGTSFAAPVVSGVVALMLQANPGLSYRDVQTILALTATKNLGDGTQGDTVWYSNGNSDWNGGGMHFSHDFGFGLVDAAAAVRMAESWESEGSEPVRVAVDQRQPANTVTDPGTGNTSWTLNFDVTSSVNVEQVLLHLELDHPRWAGLVITLISPNGTHSVLLNRNGVQSDGAILANTPGETLFSQQLMSVHFRGENSIGTWQVKVEDSLGGMETSADLFASLDIVGVERDKTKRYVITDEYIGNWKIANVPDSSPSELNMAAVSGNTSINLTTGSGNVAGKTLTVGQGVDRLVGGGGDDVFTGSANNDNLNGGTGNDRIDGGAGADSLIGGSGKDTLTGGNGHDLLEGGIGNDALFGDSGQDLLIAGQGSDTLTGGADADVFLIDGNTASTTIITDFKTANAADALVIRTQSKIPKSNITQTVIGSNLQISYDVGGGSQSKIILNGVTAVLNDSQLYTYRADSPITQDPITSGYSVGTIYVAPEWSLVFHPEEQATYRNRRFEMGLINYYADRMEQGQMQSGQIADIRDAWAEVAAGIKFEIELADGSYVDLGASDFLRRFTWSASGDGNWIISMTREYYNPTLPAYYSIENMHWRTGTAEDETLRAGGSVAKPKTISQEVWDSAMSLLGPRRYLAYDGNDIINASSEAEILDGGGGNDTLTGSSGNDSLTGGSGADVFVFNPGDGADVITDLEDIDTLRFISLSSANVTRHFNFSNVTQNGFAVETTLNYGVGSSVILGARSVDLAQWQLNSSPLYYVQYGASERQVSALIGNLATEDNDAILQDRFGSTIINALGGDDLVYALNRNGLTIDGGAGNDVIFGLAGGNTFRGGNGNDRIASISDRLGATNTADTLMGGSGNDTLTGGNGDDWLWGGENDDSLNGGAGHDHLYGDAGYNVLDGGSGNDELVGGNDGNKLSGGDGNDQLHGGLGQDTLLGDEGDDWLWGGANNDILFGGNGEDHLYGEAGFNSLNGGAGNDELIGGNDGNSLLGEDGNDTLIGGNADDVLSGGNGNDSLTGGGGNDQLLGGDGDDLLMGGAGDDYFDTGSGTDVIKLELASGNDTAAKLTGVDTVEIAGVTDFTNHNQLRFELLGNGAKVKLSWGSGFSNSLTLSSYSIGTNFKFTSATGTNSTATLRSIFENWGFFPDDSFDYLSQYDTQSVGNTSAVGILIGSENSDQLYGGPLGSATENPTLNGVRYTADSSAAYWYVTSGAGSDSLAGGLSGAILDGGVGDDKFQTTGGVTVVRDTFHGGQDTLMMPFGAVPEGLRFFRIPNPLEADYLSQYTDYPYVSAPPTSAEAALADTVIFPALWRYEDTNYKDYSKYRRWNDPSYLASIQRPAHFDTLRIQSLDGKYTVDIIGYFETGAWQNDIKNIVFPTVFDASGHSTSYSIDNFLTGDSKAGLYQYKINQKSDILDYQTWISVNNPDKTYYPHSLTVTIDLSDRQAVIGGEAGAFIKAPDRLNVFVFTNLVDYSYWGNLHRYTETQTISVSRTEYQHYKNGATMRDSKGNRDYSFEYNYLNYVAPGSSDKNSPSALFKALAPPQDQSIESSGYGTEAESFVTAAVAAGDLLLGFGGNDTIDGGGAYVETHYSGRPIYSYGSIIENQLSGSVDFTKQFSDKLIDQVNGGAGDDTYMYRRGYGNLDIIALDERLRGAEGVDTLDMSDFKWDEITIDSSTVNQGLGYYPTIEYGSFVIKVVDHTIRESKPVWDDIKKQYVDRVVDSPVYGVITIYGGTSGEYQIDKIKFADKTVDVRTLLRELTEKPTTLTAPSGETYLPTKLGASAFYNDAERFGKLVQTADISGTPANDILMTPETGIIQGGESGDFYLVDINTTEFSVVMLDKGDKVAFAQYDRANFSKIAPGIANLWTDSINQFAGKNNLDQKYLGKTQAQWMADGQLPFMDFGGTSSQIEGLNRSDFTQGLTLNLTDLVNYRGYGFNFDHKLISSSINGNTYSTDDFINLQVEWGELDPDHRGSAGTLSLSDWTPAENSQGQGIAPDALVSWDTKSSTGEMLHHYTVLAGASSSAYVLQNLLNYARPPLRGTGGDDYISDYASLASFNWGLDRLNGEYYAWTGDGPMIVHALEGNDTVLAYANEAEYTYSWGSELAWAWDDEIYGGTGNDYLDGGAGYDLLLGEDGNDTLKGGYGYSNDTLDEGGIYGYGNDTLDGGDGNDLLQGSDGDDMLSGGDGSDTLYGGGGYGADTLDGGSGDDVLQGGDGDDTYYVDLGDVITELADGGYDQVLGDSDMDLNNYGNVENVVALGSLGHRITGNQLDNTLTGNGSSAFSGGLGDDTYFIFGDTVIETENQGIDTVITEDDVLNLSSNIENLGSIGLGLTLHGNNLDNNIFGDNGDNLLDGGEGVDSLSGGIGDDEYVIDNADDVIFEGTGEGIDTVWIRNNYTLSNDGFNDIEVMRASSSLGTNMTGNLLANKLIGNVGDDTLNGGGGVNDGVDTLFGGGGDDIYILNKQSDVVVEHLDEGFDTVQSNVDYTLGMYSNIENLTLFGSSAIRAAGNEASNRLTGNSLDNRLIDEGGFGSDDTLDGGLGADFMDGGVGNDIYIVDNPGDIVFEDNSLIWDVDGYVNSGFDTILAYVNFSLGESIENISLMGDSATTANGNALRNILNGNILNNLLNGYSGDDELDGGKGLDTLVGGAGNDIYYLSADDGNIDNVLEKAGEGWDTVRLSGFAVGLTYRLAENVENAQSSQSGLNITGNSLNNLLTGDDEANILDGGAGIDQLVGGLGNDTYLVENAGDTILELMNSGIDAVKSSVSYALADNVENLGLTGTAALNATGNSLNNVLYGNTGANTLKGGGGADTMRGGQGNDTYEVDNIGDVVIEAAGEGGDTVYAGVSYSLTDNVESLRLTGTVAISATGNGLDNTIYGNAGANTLRGGKGADTLAGGAGNDIYGFARGDGVDLIVENDATVGNSDVVQFLTGVGADQLWFVHTGNNLEVSIIGTSDKLVLKDWYASSAAHVEQFKTTDGNHTLVDSRIENLVSAMVTFGIPAAGQTTLPANYQTALAPVIVANWQ
ncbi:S8 family serine peptidase (plasmid) [Methylomonas sp. MED-D]|uniref:S8 family serine peptidase n=1 Tax=Methylomonas sp. MED-D TaxID=3418768 RepID=UPI003D07AA06